MGDDVPNSFWIIPAISKEFVDAKTTLTKKSEYRNCMMVYARPPSLTGTNELMAAFTAARTAAIKRADQNATVHWRPPADEMLAPRTVRNVARNVLNAEISSALTVSLIMGF